MPYLLNNHNLSKEVVVMTVVEEVLGRQAHRGNGEQSFLWQWSQSWQMSLGRKHHITIHSFTSESQYLL